MGVREQLNQNRGWAVLVGCVIIVLALGLAYFQFAGAQSLGGVPSKQYMTSDDGKTFFVADANLIPPCSIDGKTAYLAYVFTCDGGKTKWVGFMERYSDIAKKKMAELRKERTEQKANSRPSIVPELINGCEVKKPGDATWVKRSDLAHVNAVLNVVCPNDPNRSADLVTP